MKRLLLPATALLATAALAAPTEIRITDTVRQRDVIPLGINISQTGGGSPWGVRTDKAYFCENFEGTVYRQAHQGVLHPEGFMTQYFSKDGYGKWWPKLGMEAVVIGAKVLVLSGPAKGEQRTVTGFDFVDHDLYGNGQVKAYMRLLFDRPVELPAGKPIPRMGLLLERDNSATEGCTGQVPGYWMSTNVRPVQGDVSPASIGCSALLLDTTAEQTKTDGKTGAVTGTGTFDAFYKVGIGSNRYIDQNGTWIVRLKAKALDPGATLTVSVGDFKGVAPIPVPVTDAWQEHEVRPVVAGRDVGAGTLSTMHIQFTAKGGRVLLDDLVCTKDVAYANPTIFNDEFVDALRFLKPGIIRQLMMGGTMEERLSPQVESVRSTNDVTKPVGPISLRKSCSWSLPDVYNLAEHLGAEAWVSIPGTLYPEDVDLFMEYIGGPAGTKGGDLRIRHGHPKPYTETLKKIHVEPGNEAWNTMFGFIAGGYNGPDYWEGIFTRIKASPHYRETIVCHAAGQNYSSGMSDEILGWTPSADRYAIAPYQIHQLEKSDLETFRTLEDFARYCTLYPMMSCEFPGMKRQMAVSKKHGKEFSVYEVNWHMTGGDVEPNNATPKHPEVRGMVNAFIPTVPGATAHFNHMLRLLRDFGIKSQCHFTFSGDYFNVKLWGAVLNMAKGQERHRPAGLALAMVNACMRGDLVETVHATDEPTVTATGAWPGAKKVKIPGQPRPVAEKTEATRPCLYSYAFKDGTARSLVLINLDLTQAHEVQLAFPGGAQNARSSLLAPRHWSDTNEYDQGDGSIQVAIQDVDLKDFRSGAVLSLPPASLQTIAWEEITP